MGLHPFSGGTKARRAFLNPVFSCCEYPKGRESFMTINTPGRGTHRLAKRELELRKRGADATTTFHPMSAEAGRLPCLHRRAREDRLFVAADHVHPDGCLRGSDA